MKSMILVLVMMGLSVGLSFAAADNAPKGKTVKVNGEGIVTAVPDQVVFQVSVQEEGDSLDDLVNKSKEKMNNVLAALKTFNIPDEDLQTTQYNIQRKYQYTNGHSQFDGYMLTNRLKVVLKDVKKAGAVLAALPADDASQVEGPTFGFSDPSKLQLQALKVAVENAHAKAEVLAAASGAILGPVYSIEQSGVNMPTVRPMAMMAKRSVAGADVPVEQGTDQVTAQIEVVYTLK